MDIIVTDQEWADVAAVADYDLDMAFGDDENDFAFSPNEGPDLSKGCLVYADGTEFGGIVDEVGIEAGSTGSHPTYSGRTWHGILARKVVMPPDGQDYYTWDGEANSLIGQLISKLGLGDLFQASAEDSGIQVDFQWDRFCDAWSGLRKALKSSGAKPVFRMASGRVTVSAEPSVLWGDEVDSDLVEFSITRNYRPINHLICTGGDELQDRVVVHWYADEDGSVTQTQTLFGVDEVAAQYDYNNAGEDELEEKGKEKLEDYQVEGEVEVSVIDDSVSFDVGDTVTGRDNRFGLTVTAEVVKKIVKASDGAVEVSYEVGQASSTKGLSGSAESSSGGHAYYAGYGLELSGYTFSADVGLQELAEVEDVAQASATQASNALAAAGEAQQEAESKVASVAGTAPVEASSDGGAVTVSHAQSGVAAGAYGPASDGAEPGWGGSFNVGPRVSLDACGHVTQAQGRTVRMPGGTATASEKGLMSAADKAKLDGVEEGANAYELPAATASSLGGVKPDGTTVTVSEDGTLSAQQGGAASFLAAHPVGSLYWTTEEGDPGGARGGTWEEMPMTLGGRLWKRTG